MFVTEQDIKHAEKKYGAAQRISFDPIRMLEWEFGVLKTSMRDDRRHDVTMFIEKSGYDEKYVCIQKPFYRDTIIYRAPSGGIHKGETLGEGLRREMFEETGLVVDIKRFIAIVKTHFISPDEKEHVPWTSYVFLGRDTGGRLETRDPREICDIRLCDRDEMLGAISAAMKCSGWGGFLYRAKLTAKAFEIIDRHRPESGRKAGEATG